MGRSPDYCKRLLPQLPTCGMHYMLLTRVVACAAYLVMEPQTALGPSSTLMFSLPVASNRLAARCRCFCGCALLLKLSGCIDAVRWRVAFGPRIASHAALGASWRGAAGGGLGRSPDFSKAALCCLSLRA
jgi:hypothetical protein